MFDDLLSEAVYTELLHTHNTTYPYYRSQKEILAYTG